MVYVKVEGLGFRVKARVSVRVRLGVRMRVRDRLMFWLGYG